MEWAGSVECSMCEDVFAWADLEPHLRYEVGWPAFSCAACRTDFFDAPAADAHRRRCHPSRPDLLRPASQDAALETVLRKLLDKARLTLCRQAAKAEALKQEAPDAPDQTLHQPLPNSVPSPAPFSLPPAAGLHGSELTLGSQRPALPPHSALAGTSSAEEAAAEPEPRAKAQGRRPSKHIGADGSLVEGYARGGKLCVPCDRTILANCYKQHILSFHLHEDTTRCRLCPYTSGNFNIRDALRKHFARAHPDTAMDGHFDDLRPALAQRIEGIWRSIYTKPARRACPCAGCGSPRGPSPKEHLCPKARCQMTFRVPQHLKAHIARDHKGPASLSSES